MADAPAVMIVAPLEGTLLRHRSFFPYYMLLALEAGGLLRALLLLLSSPAVFILATFISHACAIKLQVFIATAGVRLKDLQAVAAAVLPKFFLDDLEPAAYRAFMEEASDVCGRCAVSSHPKLLAEHFLRTYLRVDTVVGSQLQSSSDGVCTGFIAPSGSLLGEDAKASAAAALRGGADGGSRSLRGICNKGQQPGYLSQCEETVVIEQSSYGEKVPRQAYAAPLVFHDGRLAVRPTPLTALAVALWIPIGFLLLLVRTVAGLNLPQEIAYPGLAILGIKLRVGGAPPLPQPDDESVQKGLVFACVHRTLADPTFLTMALRHHVHCLTFSLSKISLCFSPNKATRLTRNREEDAKIMKQLLLKTDLCVCPEGTTCREPYLLRFSPLFADVADWVVPVALEVETSMFHGTSARGYKVFDSFFLGMNPTFSYKVLILDPICTRELRESGMAAIEIANSVQKLLATALGYECTNYSRKDKYSFLAGHDGSKC